MRNLFKHPLVLSFLIIAVFIFFNQQGWLKKTENVFLKLLSPGKEAFYNLSLMTKELTGFIFSLRGLENEINLLKEENRNLLSQNSQLEEVIRENRFLRKQIGLPIPESQELVMANIIGREPSGLGEYILINKGQEDGVEEKSIAITAGNILIGHVVEVTNSFSKIRLITDRNSRVNALIQESGITGLIEGGNDLNLLIDLLPQGEEIKKGQSVVTSGLAGVFPQGLLIGQIEEVISSDAQISQRAEIKPVINFSHLDKVFIIR